MLQKLAWIALLLSVVMALLNHQFVSQGGITFDSIMFGFGLTSLVAFISIYGLLFQKIPSGKKRSTYAGWGLLLILSFVVFSWHGANMRASLTNHRRWGNQLPLSATKSAPETQVVPATELEPATQPGPATGCSMDDLPNRGAE